MKNMRTNKGITLIALIITIIVLLILAIVSIKVIINEGIFKHAQNAALSHEIAQEKEQITLAYQEYQMQKANGEQSPTLTVEEAIVDGDETNGWEITFNKCGHSYTLLPDGTIIDHNLIEDDDEIAREKKLIQSAYNEYRKENTYLEDHQKLETAFLNKNLEELLDKTYYESYYSGKYNSYFNEGKSVIESEGIEIIFSEGDTQQSEDGKVSISFIYNENNYKLILNPETSICERIEYVSSAHSLKVEGATVTENRTEGWQITFNECMHQYTLLLDGTIIDNNQINDKDDEIVKEKKLIKLGYNHYRYRKIQEDPAPKDRQELESYFLVKNSNEFNALQDPNKTTKDQLGFYGMDVTMYLKDVKLSEDGSLCYYYFTYRDNRYRLVFNIKAEPPVPARLEYAPQLEIEGTTVKENTVSGWKITFNGCGHKYKLSEDGTIEGPFKVEELGEVPKTEAGGVDFEKIKSDLLLDEDRYLEKAEELGQNTTNNEDVGIGTDGNVVNLDLWTYSLNETNTVTLGRGGSLPMPAAYKGIYTEEGTIQGTIPQLIYSNEKIYEVTSAYWLFRSEELKVAPEIPTTINSSFGMFAECTSLTTAPEIPNGMKFCNFMFASCEKLTKVSVIPSSVTICNNMFENCTNLTIAPEILEGVTDCWGMFRNCINLLEAPKIPNSVTNCGSMFLGCSSLTGTITINSTPKYYDSMLKGVGSADHPITLTGECSQEVLEAIRKTGNAEYITVNKE